MIKTDNFKEVFFSRDRSVSDKFFSLMRTANALQSKLADSNKKIRFQVRMTWDQTCSEHRKLSLKGNC